MRFALRNDWGDVWELAVSGELDAVTTPQLRLTLDELVSWAPRIVRVDLSQLRLIDAVGLGTLLHFYKAVIDRGGHAAITQVSGQPLAVFRALGLDLRLSATPAPQAARPAAKI